MSTKIFNAYRFPGATNLPRLCRSLHEQLTPIYRDRALTAIAMTSLLLVNDPRPTTDPDGVSGEVAARIASDISFQQITGSAAGSGALLVVAAGIIDALQEALDRPHAKRILDPFDLVFSVVFMADPDSADWTYVKVYSDVRAYHRVWKGLPDLQEFDYWDDADQPDEIDDEAWAVRQRIWDRVLVGYDPPAKMGVVWRYKPPLPLFIQAVSDTGWLTPNAVVERIIALATDRAAMTTRRAELLDRLTGTQLGRPPGEEA